MKEGNFSRKRALQHLERVRQIVARTPTIRKYRRIEDLIIAVRKTREQLWEEKFAARS